MSQQQSLADAFVETLAAVRAMDNGIDMTHRERHVIRDLKRIHGHAVAIGYPILESANALRESRLKADEESKSEVKLASATQPGR